MKTVKPTMIQSTAVKAGRTLPPALRSTAFRPRGTPRSDRSPGATLGTALVIDLPSERRRRLTHRGIPALGGVAALALVVGVVVGSGVPSGAERTARDFGRAWQRGDIDAMYGLLGSDSRSRYSKAAFEQAYREAAATPTASRFQVGNAKGTTLPVVVHTRVFGPLRGKLRLPVSGDHVDWESRLSFPEV